MDTSLNIVGNIDYFRGKLNLSNKKMCELADIALSSYNDMCKRNTFYTSTLEKIAKVLNVEVSELVKNRENENEINKDFEEIKEKLKDFENKHLK